MPPDTDATLPDYLPDRPDILFVGINPGSYSARQGHYYARATNRFWWALHASGLIPIPLSPQDDWRVIEFGLGLTDLVKRPTNSAADVRGDEFAAGRQVLAEKIARVQPLIVCFNGLTGYQQFFQEPTQPGRQTRCLTARRCSFCPQRARVTPPTRVRSFWDIFASYTRCATNCVIVRHARRHSHGPATNP